MKNSYIPVNNNIDKAIAFAPTLSESYRKNNQRIDVKPNYIETLDTVENLMKQGWMIDSVCENRNKSNYKIDTHYVKMSHPDLIMKTSKGGTEGISNLYITNSCSGNKAMNIDLGMYRQVCSNGLISFSGERVGSISHNDKGQRKYEIVMSEINKHASKAIDSFIKFKQKELTSAQIQKLTRDALRLRFKNISDINHSQLNVAHRTEDEGNQLWNVYNRIQENLIKPNMLVDANGRLISGVSNVKQDLEVNKQLFSLMEAYA